MNSSSSCQQSLLTALNKFVQAVDRMDDRVMVPSRLKDMDVSFSEQPKIQESNNNLALLSTIKPGTNLFDFYRLLNTVKTELITGTKTEEETNEIEAPEGEIVETQTEIDTSKTTANLFKHHLSGLFNVLHQMTETAKFLTDKYESEIGGSSGKPLSSLTV